MTSRLRRTTAVLLTAAVGLVPAVAADGAAAKKRKKPTRGQCTVWANYKRPDLNIQANGAKWDNIARKRGYSVDGKPRAGDIAVWEANSMGAFSLGHVAYVVKVSKSGKLTVTEFNWGSVRERYGKRTGVSPKGLSFIHKKG